jgi:hypothetical protein
MMARYGQALHKCECAPGHAMVFGQVIGRPAVNDTMLKVRRVGAAWIVDGARGLEPLLFLSGAKAEAQAHTLARSLAEAGGDARVAVHDRSEQLVGTVRYFAADAAVGDA